MTDPITADAEVRITRVGDTVLMPTAIFDDLMERLLHAEALLGIDNQRSWFRP